MQDGEVRVNVFEEGAYQQFEVRALAGIQVAAVDRDGVVGGRGGGRAWQAALVVAAGGRRCLGCVLAKLEVEQSVDVAIGFMQRRY